MKTDKRAQTIGPRRLSKLLRSQKSKIRNSLRVAALVLPLISILLLNGGLVSSTNHQSVSGNYVPENTLERIRPGETTSSSVKAARSS